MNIVIISMDYPPQIRSISLMVREFAESCVLDGHSVTVLTGYPRYGLSKKDAARKFPAVQMENGVKVVRVKTLPTSFVAYVVRGIAQVLLPWQFRRALKKYVQESVDAVVVYSPKLPLTRIGNEIKKRHNARYVLVVQDIFPQVAIDLRALKNKWIIRYFERMEKAAYTAADVITTCTEGARRFLLERKDVPVAKVATIPNWIDVEPYKMPMKRDFRGEWGLRKNRVIVFPGIFGPSQGLDFVLHLAARIQDIDDVRFVFVGDGSEREGLQSLAKKLQLKNVLFKEFVSQEEYPDLLKAADIGLLALAHDCKTPTVPGKVYSFFAASLPVIGFLNKESAAHELIQSAGAGTVVVSNDLDAAESALRDALEQWEDFSRKGVAGREYVEEYFGKERLLEKMKMFLKERT